MCKNRDGLPEKYSKDFEKWFRFFSGNPIKETFLKSTFPQLFSEEINFFGIKVCNIIEHLAENIGELEGKIDQLEKENEVLSKINAR